MAHYNRRNPSIKTEVLKPRSNHQMVSTRTIWSARIFILTVPNLVDRFLLWTGQVSVLIERILFEEKPDFITGG